MAQPLPTLLSQVLVAFTIEFDNEFEHRAEHHTTVGGRAGRRPAGPWLVSLAMWANFMRFVGEAGTPLHQLRDQARITNLPGLRRWGYIDVAPDPTDTRAAPAHRDWLVRATSAGRRAQAVWRPLGGVIQTRWEERFGAAEIAELRVSLAAITDRLEVELPHYLPVSGVGREDPERFGRVSSAGGSSAALDLYAPLSQVLLAFAIDFERESRLSLALSANVLRVLDSAGVRVRDLPPATGVSKEAVSVSLGFLERHGFVVVEADPTAARTKLARLSTRGQAAQKNYWRVLDEVESAWRARFGDEAIERLRASLQRLLDRREAGRPTLAGGLVPYPEGWRAFRPYLAQTEAFLSEPATALPHHPMVSHRGGFPDGS